MDEKQVRIATITDSTISRTVERDVLKSIVDAMLAAEQQLCDASVQEWKRVLTDSCRKQKRSDGGTLATTC